MSQLDYEALWRRAKHAGEVSAERLYPASQPGRRRRHAHMVALREFRAMTRPPRRCCRNG